MARYYLKVIDTYSVFGFNPFSPGTEEEKARMRAGNICIPHLEQYHIEVVDHNIDPDKYEWAYCDFSLFIHAENFAELITDMVKKYGSIIVGRPVNDPCQHNSQGEMTLEIYNGYRE